MTTWTTRTGQPIHSTTTGPIFVRLPAGGARDLNAEHLDENNRRWKARREK